MLCQIDGQRAVRDQNNVVTCLLMIGEKLLIKMGNCIPCFQQSPEDYLISSGQWRRSVVKYGVRVSQVKPSNCFKRLEKLVLPSVFDTSLSLVLEHQIRPSAPSSVIPRPTCFSSSLHCCSAPFVRRRCDCLASSAPFTNIQT